MKGKLLDNLEKITDIILVLFFISMFTIYEGKKSIIYIAIAVLFLLTVVINIIKYKKILFDKKVIWMLAFTLISALSIIWAKNKSNAISVLIILIANEAIAYCAMLLVHYKKERLHYIFYSIIIGTILLGIRVFVSNGLLAYYSTRTIDGFNANYLGMYAAIAANIALYYVINNNVPKKVKTMYITGLVLCILITILSFSRKALIFLFLPMGVYYIFRDHSIKKSLIRIIVSVSICFIGLTALLKIDFLYNSFGYRIEEMINGVFNIKEVTDASVTARMKMIEVGKELFLEKPILGYGLNNYKNMLLIKKPYGMTNVYAHNNYIELAADLGIVGVLIYYSLYIYIIGYTIKNFKNINKLQLLMIGFLITLMVCEYGVVSYFGDFYHLLLSLVWMAVIYMGDEKNNEE